MKNLFKILLVLLFSSSVVFADEVNSNQEVISDSNKAVISIQKQPTDENSKQLQDIKKNWFCIIIQVNGKIQDLENKGK